MEFETNVTCRDDEGHIIGADVDFYDDSGNKVHRVVICEEQQLQELVDTIEQLDTRYVEPGSLEGKGDLDTILANTAEEIVINATTLNDLNSGDFALRNHEHTQYCVKDHASTGTGYGLGTNSLYGHVKTRNDLNAASFVSGEALSAYQGALLGKRVSDLESGVDTVTAQYYKNSLRIKIGRWSDSAGEDGTQIVVNYGTGNGIYARLYCDAPNFNYKDKDVILVLNGVPYTRTTDVNGKTGKLTINLDRGVYILTAFIKGVDGLYPASDMKIIKVE